MVPDNIADILEGGTPDLSASKEAATPSPIPLNSFIKIEGLSINRLTEFFLGIREVSTECVSGVRQPLGSENRCV